MELPDFLKETLAPLVAVVESMNKQVAAVDEKLAAMVEADEEMKRLCTMRSVGPVTAAAFVATIDDATRFEGPHQVQAYLGLVPSERSSGEEQHRGRITKTGNGKVRRLLVQVALSTMRLRKTASKPLWEWASRIEAKRGRKVAAVALARKTAGILFAMLRDKAPFIRPESERQRRHDAAEGRRLPMASHHLKSANRRTNQSRGQQLSDS